MSSASSLLKETPAKTSYTATLEFTIDIHHDNTKGRSVEHLINDIEDFLSENEEFWETFPSVIGTSIGLKEIHQNINENVN